MIETSPFDPGDLRRSMGPYQVRLSINQVISIAWMVSPLTKRTVAGVRRTAEEIIAEAIAWWRSRAKFNPEAWSYQPGQPEPAEWSFLSEGLKHGDFMSLDTGRLAARHMLAQCWFLLPPGRRSKDEVERIVRLLLDRSLAALDEDAELFEHPLR